MGVSDRTDDLWTLAEPSPELLMSQLAALKTWLARPVLTVRQAACLLAGGCPPERNFDDRVFGGYLSGGQEWEHSPEIGRKLTVDHIAEIETLLYEAMPFKGTKPVDFVALGAKIGVRPPWMEYALRDPECLNLLPQGAPDEKSDAEQVLGTQKSIPSKGGDGKRDKDPQRKLFLPILHEQMKAGKRPMEIIRQLEREFGDKAPPDSTVFGWCAKIRDGASGAR
jgi:hypothetical protein